MANVFDRYIVGDLDSINWCFDNTHFINRLNDNGITREFIVNAVLHEDPVEYEIEGNGEYAVFFNAPKDKSYKCIKTIFACKGNSIDLVTVMPDTRYESNRERTKYKSDKLKKIDKMKNNEYAKKRFR